MCRPRTARPGITAGQRHALAECRLPPAGAGAVEPPSKSLATRCSLDQRWRLSPTTRSGFLVRKPHYGARGFSDALDEHRTELAALLSHGPLPTDVTEAMRLVGEAGQVDSRENALNGTRS